MNNDKVTIVTITYNAEDVLEETILSIINQSYDNIEYIIIDGASTDGTINIIKKYEDKIAYWVSEPDDGIYFAMNKAIEKATGEWINFMNAGDTFADSDTIKNVMTNIREDSDLIYGDHLNIERKFCTVEHRQDILRSMPCCHQSLYVKTKLMKKNPFNTFYKISADYEFILKMYKKKKKFQYIKEPLSVYLGGGLSDRLVLQRDLEILTLYMNNQIDMNDIINSSAYNNFIKQSQICKERTDYVNRQAKWIKKQEKTISELHNALQNLSDIRFIYSPIKKLKTYKKLMKIYYKSKK